MMENATNQNFTMFTPAAVKALGSIHSAYILTVLLGRYFECERAGDLEANGFFTCPRLMLESRTGLTMPTINGYIRKLAEKGAIKVFHGAPGTRRRFQINERIIKGMAGRAQDLADQLGRDGGEGPWQ